MPIEILYNESQSIEIEVSYTVDISPGCKGSRGDHGEPMEPDDPPGVEVYDVEIVRVMGIGPEGDETYRWTYEQRPEWLSNRNIEDWAYEQIVERIYEGNITV